ncbi:hypothetical protein OSB04_018068 [Centaurea solstitialis]|uniref:Cytochrome P450 n=1 Tax=Centaurea solstitialis TaxID=347529 RepID=A0AA38T435_9ASTR|nr:hypothetical protein OSB04_018068 [Centaurea solstitialis]
MKLPIALHTVTIPAYRGGVTAGKICFTWLGRKPMVYITEPTMIKEVLANYYQFRQSRRGNPLMKMLTKGLVDVEADQWVKHRKIINPAFHIEKLKHMLPAFYVSCNEMINKWEILLMGKSSCEVDVLPYLQTMSSDVISRTAFGSTFEEGRKIFKLQHEMIGLIMKSARSTYFPGSMFLPTKSNKRMKEIDQKVRASIRSIINRRVVAMKAKENSNDDLLGILLNSNYEETKQGMHKNSGLSIEEVIEECRLFYLTGQETTRDLLVWAMILLGQYTYWQARARDEVNMIFNEVLRLFPPGAVIGRVVHKETRLGNIMLPAGTFLQMNTILLHYDRDIWGDDVKEFNPERFSKGILKVTKGQACYLPFGGGPRICIGQNFAMLEAKIALVMILQRFSFEISPSYSHAPHIVLTLQPQFGAQLILHKL